MCIMLSQIVDIFIEIRVFQALETPAKVHDKTPLLDTTNKSNKSSRSMKGMTPLSLKKVMTRAFRKNKSTYNVKNVKKNLDTPLKRA